MQIDPGQQLVQQLDRKKADIEMIADRATGEPDWIPALVAGLGEPRARIRCGSEKVPRRISERAPELVYPYFEVFGELLDGDNSFLKWGAVLTIANLASVDAERRIDRARPELAGRIVAQGLRVETAHYELHGSASPECGRVACGHAVDALAAVFDQIEDREAVTEFVGRQLASPRRQVRDKGQRFLRKHEGSGEP